MTLSTVVFAFLPLPPIPLPPATVPPQLLPRLNLGADTACTLRVVIADPRIDPDFTKPVRHAVDPGLARPSRCQPEVPTAIR
jgi:hypothetical protein